MIPILAAVNAASMISKVVDEVASETKKLTCGGHPAQGTKAASGHLDSFAAVLARAAEG